MEFKQAHRLENLHVSGTRVVFGKCAELAAQGIPVTALTLGQPDFDTPQYIIDACKKALDEGKTRYTDGSGIQELKEAVCQKLEKENGLHYTPNEISVTTGVAQGMFVALLSTLNPGDEVLVPDPVYLTYSEIPNIAGAVIKKYDLLEENDYQVDVDQIRSLITDKTKMLVIVSPSNPTGGVLSRASLEAIAAIAREHDLLVLSDEIYDRFVYDDEQELVSIASLPGMKALYRAQRLLQEYGHDRLASGLHRRAGEHDRAYEPAVLLHDRRRHHLRAVRRCGGPAGGGRLY